MYRVWQLSDKERENGNLHIIPHWDGDTNYYTICESEEEYQEEKAYLKKIDDEYQAAMKAYLGRE